MLCANLSAPQGARYLVEHDVWVSVGCFWERLTLKVGDQEKQMVPPQVGGLSLTW